MHLFNSKLPHGVIYGHPIARFEQNGKYFDGLGREVLQETMNRTEEEAVIAKEAEEKKKAEELKANGPVKRRGRPPGSKNKVKKDQ